MTSLVDAELLKILCCPETHQPLAEATPERVTALNDRIRAGQTRNRCGQPVTEPLDGALVRADGRFAYPVRHGIPVLLVDEGLPLG